MLTETSVFTSIYGPVSSWRFGRSLGVDIIGSTSTCSFNCVYCQLGEIQVVTQERQVFVPTEQILQDLQKFAPWDVEVITFSGSGEPTLALNLGEAIAAIKTLTQRPVVVLTNSTLLCNPEVRTALAQADIVSAKLDAVEGDRLRRINRPVAEITLDQILSGIAQFRQDYTGQLTLQTMILSPWSDREQAEYIRLIQPLKPDEVQLYIPTRPRPLIRELDARGNHSIEPRTYPTVTLKPVRFEVIQKLADRIHRETQIPVRYSPALANLAAN